MAVKYFHKITKSVYNRNYAKTGFRKTYYMYDWLWSWIYPRKFEHRDKIESVINLRDDGNEDLFLFILSHLFILSIELLNMIYPQYVYTCDISYYPIISFILNVYLFINMYYSPVSDI